MVVKPPKSGWYVLDHARDDIPIRGPYKWRETAEAVADEIGRINGQGWHLSIERIGKTSVRKPFRKPTVADVRSYCLERRNGIDAGAFVDFYESKGWRIGKSPMKDWKAAMRTWENRREHESNGSTDKKKLRDLIEGK